MLYGFVWLFGLLCVVDIYFKFIVNSMVSMLFDFICVTIKCYGC